MTQKNKRALTAHLQITNVMIKKTPLVPVTIALSLGTVVVPAYANNTTMPYLSQQKFDRCLDKLQYSSTFRGVSSTFARHRPQSPDPSVIKSLNHQPEFNKKVWDYLSVLVDEERVQDGIRAKQQWANVLRRIESRYGVKAEHVLGVWGVESNFGQTLGKKPLITSLATLSCFDRRQSYFRKEYANALRIIQNGDVAAYDMNGSWAGAFGQTQFMPSTYRELAVDFDGDGRKDLVNSVPDALASTANFLKKRGYRKGEPWGYEVKLPANYWGRSSRTNKKSIGHWRSKGITLPNGKPLPYTMRSAGLLMPAGKNGPAFLVGKNFDTFYSYNASESYALGIAQLSKLIDEENPYNVKFNKSWPTSDAGISRKQAREIQQALLNHGYNIGTVDGLIGTKTKAAIKDFQRRQGVTPVNGRAGQKFYNLITRNNAPQQSSTRFWGSVEQGFSNVNSPNVQPVQNSSSYNISNGTTTFNNSHSPSVTVNATQMVDNSVTSYSNAHNYAQTAQRQAPQRRSEPSSGVTYEPNYRSMNQTPQTLIYDNQHNMPIQQSYPQQPPVNNELINKEVIRDGDDMYIPVLDENGNLMYILAN